MSIASTAEHCTEEADDRQADESEGSFLCANAVRAAQIVMDLDRDVTALEAEGVDVERAVVCWDQLEEANRHLADVRARLANVLGRNFPQKRVTVMGAGSWDRHAKRDGATKCVDPEGLWRLVLDTRIVDPDSGEVLPTHEVIRMVYGSRSKETGLLRLTGSSPSKAEVVGIEPDEFFEKAPMVGWTLQKVG